ncbi:hypothetical protein BKA62DRAFT_728063 [Auriculariales sp. MPI-PUGE-AT-0066]|nr:hypothetical protein BKA62DRAFT_728063 [Auriculariales sp. MPI-PUGE-AT-0066]
MSMNLMTAPRRMPSPAPHTSSSSAYRETVQSYKAVSTNSSPSGLGRAKPLPSLPGSPSDTAASTLSHVGVRTRVELPVSPRHPQQPISPPTSASAIPGSKSVAESHSNPVRMSDPNPAVPARVWARGHAPSHSASSLPSKGSLTRRNAVANGSTPLSANSTRKINQRTAATRPRPRRQRSHSFSEVPESPDELRRWYDTEADILATYEDESPASAYSHDSSSTGSNSQKASPVTVKPNTAASRPRVVKQPEPTLASALFGVRHKQTMLLTLDSPTSPSSSIPPFMSDADVNRTPRAVPPPLPGSDLRPKPERDLTFLTETSSYSALRRTSSMELESPNDEYGFDDEDDDQFAQVAKLLKARFHEQDSAEKGARRKAELFVGVQAVEGRWV